MVTSLTHDEHTENVAIAYGSQEHDKTLCVIVVGVGILGLARLACGSHGIQGVDA